jgi:hypothetical protein
MHRLFCLLILVATPVVVCADIASGPKAGDKAEDFKAFGVVGLFEGKEGSYLKERKDEPTVFVFVQQEHWGRPMARFLKAIDADGKAANEKSVVVAIWLSEKPDAAKEYLPKAQKSLNFANTSLGVFEGEKSGPNNWGINTDAHCTVVVTHKGKVIESIALESVNETDAKKVLEALKKLK